MNRLLHSPGLVLTVAVSISQVIYDINIPVYAAFSTKTTYLGVIRFRFNVIPELTGISRKGPDGHEIESSEFVAITWVK